MRRYEDFCRLPLYHRLPLVLVVADFIRGQIPRQCSFCMGLAMAIEAKHDEVCDVMATRFSPRGNVVNDERLIWLFANTADPSA